MNKIPCYLEFDERTSTVTLRHAKTGCIQMTIKLESCSVSTMTRVDAQQDCDNHWIGVKPADSTVINDVLFGNKKLLVNSIDFSLVK